METPLAILLWLLVGAVGLYIIVGLITTIFAIVVGHGLKKSALRMRGTGRRRG